jgi:hypothetical protein
MSPRTRKRRLWPWIAGGALALLAIGGLVAWRTVASAYRQYYEGAYAPIRLAAGHIDDYPPEHHLDDIPWIAASFPVCQSTALQMIAAQHGIEQPRRYFDFLMGFTYGASEVPRYGFFPYGTDPETGMRVAAPYLGLERAYYVADDGPLYLAGLRAYLASGYAVRVPLDMAALYSKKGPTPHNEVLVGYDGEGFYYYETVCMSPASCEPGVRPPGERGMYVSDDVLLRAVHGQSRVFAYPWRYAFTVFEPTPVERDLGPVWTQNGQALVGGLYYGKRVGAVAVEGLAEQIEKQGPRFDVSRARFGLETAVQVRPDNVTYLREGFPGQPDIARAADLLHRAVDGYRAALEAIEDGIADEAEAAQIAEWLRDVAAAEREAGEILLEQAQ